MAIHTLVVISVAKMVIKKYNLFWLHFYGGESQGKAKCKWRSWLKLLNQLEKRD